MISFKGNAAQAAEDQKTAYNVAPKGTYFLTVVDAKERRTKTGRDMIELELVVSSGQYAEKTRVWDYLVFIEEGAKGHGMTLHALHAFGFPHDGDINVSAQDFIGRTVKADLEEGEYNGKPKNEITKYHVVEDEQAAAPAEQQAPPEEQTPDWVDEGTLKGAQKTAAARTAAPARAPAPAPAAGRKLPWGAKR